MNDKAEEMYDKFAITIASNKAYSPAERLAAMQVRVQIETLRKMRSMGLMSGLV